IAPSTRGHDEKVCRYRVRAKARNRVTTTSKQRSAKPMPKDVEVKAKLAPHVHRALKLASEKKRGPGQMSLYIGDLIEASVYEKAKSDALIADALAEGRRPMRSEEEQ